MVSLCTTVYDVDGRLINFRAAPQPKQINRRAKVVPVLDLDVGAVLVDGGYSVTDLSYSVSVPDIDGSFYLGLKRMVSLYQALTFASEEGLYLSSIANLRNSNGETKFTANVLQDLTV